MTDKKRITLGSFLLGLITLSTLSGCIVEPREGDYDHNHHRWYHEHRWQECGDRDDHCHWH
jgi:hypothetical protein